MVSSLRCCVPADIWPTVYEQIRYGITSEMQPDAVIQVELQDPAVSIVVQ